MTAQIDNDSIGRDEGAIPEADCDAVSGIRRGIQGPNPWNISRPCRRSRHPKAITVSQRLRAEERIRPAKNPVRPIIGRERQAADIKGHQRIIAEPTIYRSFVMPETRLVHEMHRWRADLF